MNRSRFRITISNMLTSVITAGLLLLSLNSFSGTDLYFVHGDHLGTPQMMTDANQNVVWQTESQGPFGEVEVNDDPDGDGKSVTLNLRFAGQYFDEETGTSYNWHRTYDPKLGRYLQSDPIGLNGGINTYAYVEGNPINFVDPDGLNARRVNAPSPSQGLINLHVNMLINQIRRMDPSFSYRTVRPVSPSGRYNRNDITALQNARTQYRQAHLAAAQTACYAPGTTAPVGRSGQQPLNVVRGLSNLPTAINGRFFTQHAFQRMQGRGIPPSAVANTLAYGRTSSGNRPNTTVHTGAGVTVVTNTSTGNVISVVNNGF